MTASNTTADLQTVAEQILTDNLGVSPDETLLIVTDDEKGDIGRALFNAGSALDVEVGLLEMEPLEQSGHEPPGYVSEAMKAVDVVICPTSASLTHTHAREQAVESGARVATMPGITERMFHSGAMAADYNRVRSLTEAISERLTAASEARIENGGEILTLSIDGRDGIVSDGVVENPSEYGNLPSGEGYVAPVEDSANGTLVVDGGLAGIGTLSSPLDIEISNGDIVTVSGEAADEFSEALGDQDCARRVCEFGIGTNPSAEIIGTVLEDEKVYGTCHIAFGDNHGFGGAIECGSHLDAVVKEPDVYLDDELVVTGGEVKV